MSSAAVVLTCALGLLGRSPANFPPVAFVDVIPSEASRHVQAFVRPGDRTIYLVTSSAMFRDAASMWGCDDYNSLKHLAGVLAHEEWHILHGSDERGAYQTQLSTLIRLGVSPGSATYASVVRSMLKVLEKKKPKKADMVVAER